MTFKHYSVLLTETIDVLNVKAGGLYIDGTTGGGGHSAEIANRGGRLVCFDRDSEAITAAAARLAPYPDVVFVKDNFSNAGKHLSSLGITEIDGAVLDLGVSSRQLEGDRGFSFHEDAPLDMRMSHEGMTAADVVNTYQADELTRILFSYGEEKYARGIVAGIVSYRETKPIETTLELAEIIKRNVPLSYRNDKHPCRKSFMALRIEVNAELDSLKQGLDTLLSLLKVGGRLAVITFHSLEYDIVTKKFRDISRSCTCPPGLPACACGGVKKYDLVNRKPILPSAAELEENIRSRTAKLRCIERSAP
ncbi:MAG: 16S rRNA (cytosine(1402)-N(4))-methyltransferase RsmH [Oscillospiraceae bacterium]|jgi:16S rRNA (cytosine1402-N4)-methyltransferase|nr:16S rRNA (cytosine(1402)-N(4))-methyltransferase RsmH [Oscillospiraceae bacterium]